MESTSSAQRDTGNCVAMLSSYLASVYEASYVKLSASVLSTNAADVCMDPSTSAGPSS